MCSIEVSTPLISIASQRRWCASDKGLLTAFAPPDAS